MRRITDNTKIIRQRTINPNKKRERQDKKRSRRNKRDEKNTYIETTLKPKRKR